MATTTKKKTTTTTVKATEPAEVETKAVAEVKPAMTRYKFIANCDNINVNNVIFNNIKVVIYEVDALTYDAAFDSFQKAVINMFGGDIPNYNKFMKAVFGDDILVESVAVDDIKQDIAQIH